MFTEYYWCQFLSKFQVASDFVYLINGLNILGFKTCEQKGYNLKWLTNTSYPCGTMLTKENGYRKVLY